MTNTVALRETIDKSGVTLTFIANRLGISREGFYKKINNETEFKASEIKGLKEVLNLSNQERDNIFFAELVE